MAHGGEATRVALQRVRWGAGKRGRSCAISFPRARTTVSPSLQLGVLGPGAERARLASLPGQCTRGPQGDAAGAALATCGGARKALPLQRVPGVGPGRVPGNAPRREGSVVSPPPHVSLSSPLPGDLGGGGEVGRQAGLQTVQAGEPELGSWGSPSENRSTRWKELGREGRHRGGPGCGAGDSPFPSEWRGGPLPRGTPTQPFPTSRTKGLGSTVGVGERRWREAGRQAVGVGEGVSPRFLSRPNDGNLPPANASLRPLLNPGGLGFLT